MSGPAIHNHFASKVEFMVAAAQVALADLGSRSAPAPRAPRARLEPRIHLDRSRRVGIDHRVGVWRRGGRWLNRGVTAIDLALVSERLAAVLEQMLVEHPALHSAAVALLGPDGERAEVVPASPTRPAARR